MFVDVGGVSGGHHTAWSEDIKIDIKLSDNNKCGYMRGLITYKKQ
jgi:hypothetical protein